MSHMVVSAELKARVNARLAECKKLTGIDVGKLDVRYDINSQRLGGQAVYRGNIIRLNPVFLNAHTDHYLLTTVAHEYAHLAAYHKYGRAGHGHGAHWKNVFAMCGSPVSRCHNYTVPEELKQKVGKTVARHEAHCEKCGHKFEITSKRVSKMKAGATYRHTSCGGLLVLGAKDVLKLSGKMVSIPTAKALAHTVPAAPAALTGSKLDKCRQLWKTHNNLPRAPQSRDTMIDLFVTFAGCTPAGAATYYAKLKKEMP